MRCCGREKCPAGRLGVYQPTGSRRAGQRQDRRNSAAATSGRPPMQRPGGTTDRTSARPRLSNRTARSRPGWGPLQARGTQDRAQIDGRSASTYDKQPGCWNRATHRTWSTLLTALSDAARHPTRTAWSTIRDTEQARRPAPSLNPRSREPVRGVFGRLRVETNGDQQRTPRAQVLAGMTACGRTDLARRCRPRVVT